MPDEYCFPTRKEKKVYLAPGDRRRFQLDYIMVRQSYVNIVKNAPTYLCADVNSDHNLVVMKVRLKLMKRATKHKME